VRALAAAERAALARRMAAGYWRLAQALAMLVQPGQPA